MARTIEERYRSVAQYGDDPVRVRAVAIGREDKELGDYCDQVIAGTIKPGKAKQAEPEIENTDAKATLKEEAQPSKEQGSKKAGKGNGKIAPSELKCDKCGKVAKSELGLKFHKKSCKGKSA